MPMSERWRNVLNSATGDPLVQVVQSLEAENNRLRAVVNDYRRMSDGALHMLREVTDRLRDSGDHDTADRTANLYRTIFAATKHLTERLDVSEDMGRPSALDGTNDPETYDDLAGEPEPWGDEIRSGSPSGVEPGGGPLDRQVDRPTPTPDMGLVDPAPALAGRDAWIWVCACGTRTALTRCTVCRWTRPMPPSEVRDYPHESGDVVVLGPQVFVAQDGSVLNWAGVNYVPQVPEDDAAVIRDNLAFYPAAAGNPCRIRFATQSGYYECVLPYGHEGAHEADTVAEDDPRVLRTDEALAAHREGRPVSLNRETGEWTIRDA